MFKELKTGKCLGAEKGEMPYRGALSQSVRAVCPSEAFHSANMSIHYGRTDKKSVCLPGPELVLPRGPFVLEIAFQMNLPKTLVLPCAVMSFELKSDFSWAPLSSSWLCCVALVLS